MDDLVGSKRPVRSVPPGDGDAHGGHRPARVLRELGTELPARHPVPDDLVEHPLLLVAQRDVGLPAVRFHAAHLGGGDEGLIAPEHVEPQQGLDDRVEPLGGRGAGLRQGPPAAVEQIAHHRRRQRDQQRLLRRVVVVQARHRQPGPGGDLPDRGAVVTALGERLEGGLERLGQGRRPVLPPRSRFDGFLTRFHGITVGDPGGPAERHRRPARHRIAVPVPAPVSSRRRRRAPCRAGFGPRACRHSRR